jgi:hypothetical protein
MGHFIELRCLRAFAVDGAAAPSSQDSNARPKANDLCFRRYRTAPSGLLKQDNGRIGVS